MNDMRKTALIVYFTITIVVIITTIILLTYFQGY